MRTFSSSPTYQFVYSQKRTQSIKSSTYVYIIAVVQCIYGKASGFVSYQSSRDDLSEYFFKARAGSIFLYAAAIDKGFRY
jgi:hypothetical protein